MLWVALAVLGLIIVVGVLRSKGRGAAPAQITDAEVMQIGGALATLKASALAGGGAEATFRTGPISIALAIVAERPGWTYYASAVVARQPQAGLYVIGLINGLQLPIGGAVDVVVNQFGRYTLKIAVPEGEHAAWAAQPVIANVDVATRRAIAEGIETALGDRVSSVHTFSV